MKGHCNACGVYDILDKAHIKSKGSGGSMSDANLLQLCRIHHIQQHQYGWPKFLKLYPNIKHELRKKGWALIEEFGIQKLRKLEGKND